jgi:hypothetical protein
MYAVSMSSRVYHLLYASDAYTLCGFKVLDLKESRITSWFATSILSVLRASVVTKARKSVHDGDTESTEKPVGREIRTTGKRAVCCWLFPVC